MGTEISPTRHAQVEGRDVFVFDGLIADADLGSYAEALGRASFTRTEFAKPETVDYKHWASEMPLANAVRLPLWPATERAVAHARPGEAYRPYRAYTNYAAYGDMLYTHVDCPPDRRGLTALWFLSNHWEPEWGGETMFFDASGDAMFCVSPRPGRLVLFDGAIPHAGRPPSRICFAPRYSFAIKLDPATAN
ncbi:2OG-Fe(II) oxygenase [Sphingomonas sp. SUN039]|uniref:2OG-Fe(II) oxygenase n=1 Tax=Sphingomonas sp. SUN039 TaxID=2937787 RepID=UPI002164E68A|nr:2OG-Fe(II) oxygenase [Sphingomonas sp. SUN039]UVO53936.1 2OG-Fe(II) oxygenase [Sphingomonas sp. SUN039]